MKTEIENRFIWISGGLVHLPDAKINVLSPTSQFGLNVFEGIRCYWNDEKKQLYAFRLTDHFNRLKRSQKLLQMDDTFTTEELRRAFFETVKANDYKEDIAVRQTLFIDGFGSWASSGPVNMFISPIPKARTNSEYNKRGLNCCVSSWRRIGDTDLSPRIKCGANYINSRAAQLEALKNGYDTALFLNAKGTLAEGPGSCLFVVKDGKLITPLLTDSVLESITRDTVIKIAKRENIPFEERSIDRTEIYTADEAFLCGSAMEITPIFSVDKLKLGNGSAGELTKTIHEKYLQIARGNDNRFEQWVDPIY